MAGLYDSLDAPPLVSVLMPVFDPPEDALRKAIESVRAQAYANWELCLADDASSAPHVATVLHEYAALDPRIRVVRRAHNGGISEASNSALELARGTLVALLDHDDLLRPHSLLLSVLPFLEDSRVGFVYSDADRVDVDGRRISHYFKPDWSPTLLLCQNYLCHLSVIRTDLVRAVGGFRKRFDGSQDWDLALRVTERMPREGRRSRAPRPLPLAGDRGVRRLGGARGEAVRRRRGETGGRGAPRTRSAGPGMSSPSATTRRSGSSSGHPRHP